MKTLIYWTIFVLIIFSSCTTQKRCALKFPPSERTIITKHDTTIIKETFRDTIVNYHIKKDTITNSVTIPCPPVSNYIPDTARAENLFSIAKAWFDWPKIKLTLILKEQDLQFRLDNAIHEKNVFRMLYEQEKQKTVEKVKYVPTFWKITGWSGIVSIIMIVAYLAFKMRKLI